MEWIPFAIVIVVFVGEEGTEPQMIIQCCFSNEISSGPFFVLLSTHLSCGHAV